MSSVELLRATFDAIDGLNSSIKAFLSLADQDHLLRLAREVDTKRVRGDILPNFAGIPIAIKDNIAVKGQPLTCGSRILENYYPPYNATVIERIQAAGLLVVGKTNMDEFGFGSSTENSAFFATRNPHSLDRVPGGSSGGSAAAVAGGILPWALGTDTGGSVRQPASLCGVVGFRPTYGRVSRNGLVAFCSSMDQIGPLTNNVTDAGALNSIIAGHDVNDSTTLPAGRETGEAPATLRIGIPIEYTSPSCQREVVETVSQIAGLADELDWSIMSVSLPLTESALSMYYVISSVEAHSNLARYDGVKYAYRAHGADAYDDMVVKTRTEAFGMEAKRRILLGTFAASAGYQDKYYVRACQARIALQQEFARTFRQVDLLLSPISPTTAWRLGERTDDPMRMYMSDIFSIPAAAAGLPALVVPAGRDADGLPIGVQLCGAFGEDALVLSAGRKLEAAIGAHGGAF